MAKLRVVVNAGNVVDLRGVSWEKLREQHDRALQMGEQAVGAFADAGDMLMALKLNTPDGEFTHRCRAALYEPDMACQVKDEAVWQKASRYMRLASARAKWEPQHPASLNEALKLIAPPKQQKSYRPNGWAAYLADRLGGDQRDYSAIANGKRKAELLALPGFPSGGERKGFFDSAEQERTFGDAFVRHFSPEIEAPTLDPKGAKTVQRALDAETAKIYRELNDFVAGKVHEETAAQRAEMDKATQRANDTVRSYEIAIKKINDFMSLDEYRLILNCLHPDRVEESRRDRCAQAFGIMKRLDKYFA